MPVGKRESRGRTAAPFRRDRARLDDGIPDTTRSAEHEQPPRPGGSSAGRVRISSNRVCGIVRHAAARNASVRGAVRVSVRVGSDHVANLSQNLNARREEIAITVDDRGKLPFEEGGSAWRSDLVAIRQPPIFVYFEEPLMGLVAR
jgi:hypothetical protein